MEDLQIVIGGPAGAGTKSTGHLIARTLNRCGYRSFVHEDYPSVIRGDHNFSVIRVSSGGRRGIRKGIDLLVALDGETAERHKEELQGKMIYDSDCVKSEEGVAVAAGTIAKEEGEPIMRGNALYGALCRVMGVEWEVIEEVMEGFPKKEENLKVIKRGYDSAKEEGELKRGEAVPLLSGNEALALGAMEAGLESYFAYPMTPATSILHFFAKKGKKKGIDVFQPENEIGVINGAIGCAYAGKRTMVATSGGGFALMGEGISLAAMSETPMVIVNSQRTGPASGVPTYNSQSDLLFVLHPGQGDFLNLVVAPGDAEEAFLLANLALNMSWKYQIPSIVLMDKDVSESTFSFDENVLEEAEIWREKEGEPVSEYKRYEITDDGVSPYVAPGGEAIVKGTSYECDERGLTTEDPEEVSVMQEKRLRKREYIEKELEGMEKVKISGEGEKVLFCWGSTKMAAKEAGEELGYKVVQILLFKPFPIEEIKREAEGAEEVVVTEANSLGQAAELIGNHIKIDRKILKYNGRPFTKEELKERIVNS